MTFRARRGPQDSQTKPTERLSNSMATYRGRRSDICRKVGFNIWGRAKCPSVKRPYPPGQHGPNQRERRMSEYGEQLLAKQVIRRYYGMLEKQFRRTFEKAQRMRGNSGLNFLRLLELRLQTQVYRMGFANTIEQARQMVSHQHIFVNARKNSYEGAAVPVYIEPDVPNYAGKIIALPEREDFPKFMEEQKVVEFYAR